MRFDAGILSGNPRWEPHEVLVLAHTSGVPLEWIYAALRLSKRRRKQLKHLIRAADNVELRELGGQNAASVEVGDGWKMIVAVNPGYVGPVPLYSQLELLADPRTDVEVGQALGGVCRQKVRRWRVNTIFCPLTGVRLVGGRGQLAKYNRL